MWAIKKMLFNRHRARLIARKTVNLANRFVIRDAHLMHVR
jgi:hypothetical protein